MKKKPVVSVITVVFNAGMSIDKTIASVADKNFDHELYEHIVIDGGSTDSTIDVLRSFGNRIFWISDADKGIYDAMNKGIKLSKGKFVYFLNAGDELDLLPLDLLGEDQSSDIVCFPVRLSNGEIFVPNINFLLAIRNSLPHQGCFYRLNDSLQYNLNYKIFADFDLNQKIFKLKGIIKVNNTPVVAYHDLGGISHEKSSFGEIFKVVEGNYGKSVMYLSYFYFKLRGLKNKLKLKL